MFLPCPLLLPLSSALSPQPLLYAATLCLHYKSSGTTVELALPTPQRCRPTTQLKRCQRLSGPLGDSDCTPPSWQGNGRRVDGVAVASLTCLCLDVNVRCEQHTSSIHANVIDNRIAAGLARANPWRRLAQGRVASHITYQERWKEGNLIEINLKYLLSEVYRGVLHSKSESRARVLLSGVFRQSTEPCKTYGCHYLTFFPPLPFPGFPPTCFLPLFSFFLPAISSSTQPYHLVSRTRRFGLYTFFLSRYPEIARQQWAALLTSICIST